MRHSVLAALFGSSLLVLSACGSPQEDTQPAGEAGPGEESPAAPENDAAPAAAAETPDLSDLSNVLAGEWRAADAERDAWRHPAETLEFFGVDPSSTVVEIWPGGGWYTNILAPWVAANGGTYVAAHFPTNSPSDYRQRSRSAFVRQIADTDIYGNVTVAEFTPQRGLSVPDGSADAVLTFRNIHNWMASGYAERAFEEFHDALRPGGILGVVEHRLPSTREQDPMAGSGYVQQDYVIAMAEEAGFEFVEASEVNANPADTADHPLGVWTLPPVRRSPAEGEEGYEDFDRAAYDAIGESDRMTLLFRKPETAPADAEDEEGGEE